MKDIAIYGAGGLGREVAALLIKMINEGDCNWNLVGFFDDGVEKGKKVSHYGYALGGIDELNNWPDSLDIIFAFGIPSTCKAVHSKIINRRIRFPNLIAPDFRIADIETFSIGIGNIIKEGCYVSTDVSVGDFNLFNGDVVLGHNVTVGAYNRIMPGVRVSGDVNLGNECLIGGMSFIHQGLNVPNKVTVGPLSALLSKPKEGGTYIGNPAKRLKF